MADCEVFNDALSTAVTMSDSENVEYFEMNPLRPSRSYTLHYFTKTTKVLIQYSDVKFSNGGRTPVILGHVTSLR